MNLSPVIKEVGDFSKTSCSLKCLSFKTYLVSRHFSEDLHVKLKDSRGTLIGRCLFHSLLIPSALVGGQFFLKNGCSLLQKVDLERHLV